MCYMQQNVCLPVKGTKTFTLIENNRVAREKGATGPTKGVSKYILKQHVCRYDILRLKRFRGPALRKPKFGKYLTAL